jgi:hypothetical protein
MKRVAVQRRAIEERKGTMPKVKVMDSFLGRDHVETSVYAHGQINLYCKFSDALIQMDTEQWEAIVAFVNDPPLKGRACFGKPR